MELDAPSAWTGQAIASQQDKTAELSLQLHWENHHR
jgi:hypothetical protein